MKETKTDESKMNIDVSIDPIVERRTSSTIIRRRKKSIQVDMDREKNITNDEVKTKETVKINKEKTESEKKSKNKEKTDPKGQYLFFRLLILVQYFEL